MSAHRGVTQRPSTEANRAVAWSCEQVPATGQQMDRIRDGLSIVFELLARRYRREHGRGNPSTWAKNRLDYGC